MGNPVVLVTGCAGFIGSNFVRACLEDGVAAQLVGYDLLTPQAAWSTIAPLVDAGDLRFVRGDVTDLAALQDALRTHRVTHVVHFAAESHNDRAIVAPASFFQTNVTGTATVLDAARRAGVRRVVHVSTIEVYGVLRGDALFNESSPLDPRTPYAASKAAGDLAARAFARTWSELEVVITHAANNIGPWQFPEKFVPTCIIKALRGEPIPLYGDGRYERDWIGVGDHVRALRELLLRPGIVPAGEPLVVDLSGRAMVRNDLIASSVLRVLGLPADRVRQVADRPNHDRRYGIDPSFAERLLALPPSPPLDALIEATVRWYVDHEGWWAPLAARPGVWFDWSKTAIEPSV